MTHRERVLAALDHNEPDRVPMDLGGTLATTVAGHAYPALRRALGLPPQETEESLHYASLAVVDEEVRRALDVDLIRAPDAFGTDKSVEILSEDRFIDEWGVTWHKPTDGHYYVEHAPFEDDATPGAVERFCWPALEGLVRVEGLAESLRELRSTTDYAVCLELRGRVMSIGQFLRGFEAWMMDLACNQDFVEALLERTTQAQLAVNDVLLREVGDLVDVVYTSDDLGGQGGTLVSPSCFAEFFRPHFETIWGHARRSTDARLMHHCCGSAYGFLGDFIDLGVQALNPVQVSAANMDPELLTREFGEHLCFWGGVDTRYVMPRGSVEDVRREVELRIRQMAPGGGYILAAVHNLQPEVPPENIAAMYRAGKELGRYPVG